MRHDCSTYRRPGQCFMGAIINFSFLLSTARIPALTNGTMGVRNSAGLHDVITKTTSSREIPNCPGCKMRGSLLIITAF